MTELRLYQTIHIARGRARNVAAHIALLDAAARTLFGRRYMPGTEHLTSRIEALAAAERYPRAVSGFVRLELAPDGREELLAAGTSLYDGYALRSLMPEAATVRYDLPLTDAPTTLREAAVALADLEAARRGATKAVRCTADGTLLSADDAPLFAVSGHTLLAPPAPASVEGTLLREAARRIGLTLREEPVRCGDLRRLDELLYVDHRGITVLSRCNGIPFMSLTAERLAESLEALFPKM